MVSKANGSVVFPMGGPGFGNMRRKALEESGGSPEFMW